MRKIRGAGDDVDSTDLEGRTTFAFGSVVGAVEEALREWSAENGGCIIATTSVTAYRGTTHLLDYSASKCAVLALTRTLAKSLVKRGIRVNGVAPGPIWTPLIPATFSPEHVEKFGSNTLMGRAGQPAEVADASYFTGQVLHPNGGDVMM